MDQSSNPSATDAGNSNSNSNSNGNRAAALPRLTVSPEAAGALPAEFIKRHRVLPLKMSGGTIVIATAEPGNQRVIDDIRLLTGLEVEEHEAVESCRIAGKDRRVLPGDGRADDRKPRPAAPTSVAEKNLHDIEVMANEPTVVNLVNVIISTALRERASDIHLVPFEKTLQLRYRIDGCCRKSRRRPNNFMPPWFRASKSWPT